MSGRPNYVNVPQRDIATGPSNVAYGSFGASTCVIVAGVNAKAHTVAHIDAATPSLISRFPINCKLTMTDTGQNGPLLAALLATQPPGAVTIVKGSSLMVCDGVVTPGIGPPVRVDTASMDKLAADLISMVDAVIAMPEEPPGAGTTPAGTPRYLDFFSAPEWEWFPTEQGDLGEIEPVD